jgi:hypothetical protein
MRHFNALGMGLTQSATSFSSPYSPYRLYGRDCDMSHTHHTYIPIWIAQRSATESFCSTGPHLRRSELVHRNCRIPAIASIFQCWSAHLRRWREERAPMTKWSERGSGWEVLTAGAFVAIVVPLIVFFALQRYFVRGLLAGSVKG